jgi:non-reducing end alpha-L-arabinofuranosidase
MQYFGFPKCFKVMIAVLVGLFVVQEKIDAAKCPCDIYADGGTPCVAAHSTVRALYSSYNGSLYQVRRTSDKQTRDIGVLTPGGYANAAAQDSFLNGKPGTISIIYDQSPKGNHLPVTPKGGYLPNGGTEANAADTSIMLNGHKVYGLYKKPYMGYRNNKTNGVATGNQPEGMYMVTSGKHYNDSCCFDYGNGETNMLNNGTGTMEAIYFGTLCWFKPCNGSGPWVFADFEMGLWTSSQNISVRYDYVTSMLKGDAKTYSLKAGNAQTGNLTIISNNTSRPAPNKLEGAIILGIGGDQSWGGTGTFFEGAMTFGRPPDSTDDAIQKNIIAAGYGSAIVSISHGGNSVEATPGSPFTVKFNPSSAIAVIGYTLPNAGRVRLNFFDQQGRRIATIIDAVKPAGRQEAVWDAKRVPAGVYLCRLTIDGLEGWFGKVVIGK